MSANMNTSHEPILAIFDHDGVLVDTLKFHQDAWIALGPRIGHTITAEFVHETFGMTNPTIFRSLLGDTASIEDIQRHGDDKEACYRDLARGKLILIEGVRAFLDELSKARVQLAVGSSAPRPNVELTIEECGLAGRFSAIAALEDIVRGKPDPQVFLLAANRAGVPPSRTVVFEDAPVGIRAAKAAGMYAVGITNTHPAKSLFEAGADEVVASLVGFDVARLVGRLSRNGAERGG